MKSRRSVAAPSIIVTNAMAVRSVPPFTFFTINAAKGAEAMTPIDSDQVRSQFIVVPDTRNVANPTRLTKSSEKLWMETASFSLVFMYNNPVVTIGPKPLPLIPLLKLPKRLNKPNLIQLNSMLRVLFSSKKTPVPIIRVPI